ncbi:MAG TPA: hypothetical protein VNT03_17665 [Baekduia sp.]|nr:hypothetical protein [Baekduia sp.]
MADQIPPEVRAARKDVTRLVDQRNALLRAGARDGAVDHAKLVAIDDKIGGLLDGVLALTDPCDASPTEPLVLLPVRLETRFAKKGRGTTLRVRIFPDEIHVDDLARGLTDDEITAGRAYWTAAWVDPVPEAAWPQLVAAVGPDRAEWVAHACTPTNLGARATDAAPEFSTPAPRGPRNIVARALPDRFVVVAVQGGKVSQAVGATVPRDLSMTPIAVDSDLPDRPKDALAVPPGSEWLVDYDAAVAVGMAVTVTLSGGTAPVDRVIALGTRASLTPAGGADELEDLLIGHRFGAAGLALLAQGVPTNNADAERSPYRARREPQAPAPVPDAALPGSDAAAAAAQLGIDAALLSGLVGHGTGEQAIAGQVNTALWAPGWGEYLDRLDEQGVPGVVDAQRESARRLFRDHVRGRGPAPAVRVGAQPYGVLPVSDLDAWVPQAGELTGGIVTVVRTLLARWRTAAQRRVPRVRPGDANLEATVLEVLGSSPVMQGLRVRPVLSDDVSAAVLASMGLDHREYEAEQISTAAIVATLLGASAKKMAPGSLHRETRPLPLPLASERDPAFIAALIGSPSQVLAVDSVLQALLFLAWDSSELDVAKAAPATVLPALIDLGLVRDDLKLQAAALVGRAETAAPEELHGLAEALVDAGVMAGGASMLREFQPAPQIDTSLAEVALSAPVSDDARRVAASALTWWLTAMGYRSEVRAAMQALTTTDVAARSLAVAEALDCSSHRLDAWATGIVAERRARQLAGRAPGAGRGLTIGAYGVVENLQPAAGPSSDGWIHAPTTRHAAAAGMLRSAHLSHLPASGPASAGGPFAIDLSSGRIRGASHVIEGVRQGQQLGALIGYQIERALADARLARLQLSLRAIAPLVARRLHDADGADDQAAQEAIAATNVVDGVLLLKRHPPGDETLRAALDVPPQNAFLAPGDWPALKNSEWNTLTSILRSAADTIDAVADVMLSESVLQYAGGNAHRAAAAMDAMATGASPSDTIDVLESQDSGERLTHRVLAIVGDGAPASGWNALRPRAQAEPRLEAWAGAYLGDPADIVVADVGGSRVTLDAAGIAALDLVFTAELSDLERSLRASIPGLGDAPLAITRDPAWPKRLRGLGQVVGLAATLRATIAGSHPLLPADLARPAETPTRSLDAALPELVGRVGALVGALNAAVAAIAPTVATIPADGIVADDATAAALAAAAQVLEPFGIPLGGDPALPLDVAWVRGAFQAAEARGLAAQAAVDAIAALPADTQASLVLDAAQDAVAAVLGDSFLVVPLLAPAAGDDAFVDAIADPAFPAPPATAVRRFMRDVGTVRQQVTRHTELLLLGGALGHARELDVVQLAERNGAPAPGTTRWLAGPLPAEGPWPASSVAHLVLDRVGTVDAAATVAGLAIDAWVEDLPAQPGPKADPDDPRPGRARTGLAVRADAASARAPQSLLCAVSPDGKRWTVDALRGVIEHTLDLAKVRMVTLERLGGEGLVLPALYTRSSSLQGRRHLDFTLLADAKVGTMMPFVKETPT